jgi:hypothetical protein
MTIPTAWHAEGSCAVWKHRIIEWYCHSPPPHRASTRCVRCCIACTIRTHIQSIGDCFIPCPSMQRECAQEHERHSPWATLFLFVSLTPCCFCIRVPPALLCLAPHHHDFLVCCFYLFFVSTQKARMFMEPSHMLHKQKTQCTQKKDDIIFFNHTDAFYAYGIILGRP